MGVGEGEARLGEIAASIEFDLITVFPKVIADGLFGEGVLPFRGFGEGEAFLKGEGLFPAQGQGDAAVEDIDDLLFAIGFVQEDGIPGILGFRKGAGTDVGVPLFDVGSDLLVGVDQ